MREVKLEFLTDDELAHSICTKYWQQSSEQKFLIKVSDIATAYNMKVCEVSKFVEKHSLVWSEEVCCGRCGKPYGFSTRSRYLLRRQLIGKACKACCNINNKPDTNKKNEFISRMWKFARNNVADISLLGLKKKIYLLAAIRALANENYSLIGPLCNYPRCTLSPDNGYDYIILRYLIENSLLVVSANSIDAVQVNYENRIKLDFELCSFNIIYDNEKVNILNSEFLDDKVLLNIKQSSEFELLCREVQLYECTSFLKMMLSMHQFNFNPGEKSRQAFLRCLEHFSVSQVYSFISRSAKDAAAYYMRGSVSKQHAANMVVGSIVRNMELALINKWNIKPFRRNYKLPQSAISSLIFNDVLRTDDGGFHNKIIDIL